MCNTISIDISPHSFTWERYIGVMGYSTQDVWDFDKNCPMSGFVELGRTDARSIPMRPRDGIAVMLEDESGERFWLHVYAGEYEKAGEMER